MELQDKERRPPRHPLRRVHTRFVLAALVAVVSAAVAAGLALAKTRSIDVAVLQASGAASLKTVSLGNSARSRSASR